MFEERIKRSFNTLSRFVEVKRNQTEETKRQGKFSIGLKSFHYLIRRSEFVVCKTVLWRNNIKPNSSSSVRTSQHMIGYLLMCIGSLLDRLSIPPPDLKKVTSISKENLTRSWWDCEMGAGGTSNTFRGCWWDCGGMGGGGTARPRYFSAPPVFGVAGSSSSSWTVSHLEEERIGHWRRMIRMRMIWWEVGNIITRSQCDDL